jgi:hypothetical protein
MLGETRVLYNQSILARQCNFSWVFSFLSMRPRSQIQSVIIYKRENEDDEYTPLKIEVNSWVSLQPGKQGGHAADARRHGGNSILGAYKATVLKFQAQSGTSTVSKILV